MMKTVAWTIISIAIEGLLFLWFVLYMTGCAYTHNSMIPLQTPQIVNHAEISPKKTTMLVWTYTANELPLVFFTIQEETNFPGQFYTIGTTTNLFFPLYDWSQYTQAFYRCGADWIDPNM